MKTSREFGVMLIVVFLWVLGLQILQYVLHLFTARLVGRNKPVPFKYRVQQSWYQMICYGVFTLVLSMGILSELYHHYLVHLQQSTKGLGFCPPNPLERMSLDLPTCVYVWEWRCLDVSWVSMLLGSWIFAGYPHPMSTWMKVMYTVEAAFYVEQLFWLIHRSHRHWLWEKQKQAWEREGRPSLTDTIALSKNSGGEILDVPEPPPLPLTSDHNMLILHHTVVLILLAASFLAKYGRIGVIVMLLHDVCDPFLHGAKLCRYLASLPKNLPSRPVQNGGESTVKGLTDLDDESAASPSGQPQQRRRQNHQQKQKKRKDSSNPAERQPPPKESSDVLQNVVFVIFALLFFVGRLIFLPRLLWAIWSDSEVYFPPDLYMELEWTRLLWVTALSPLIILHMYWFFMICKIIGTAFTEGSLRDGRDQDDPKGSDFATPSKSHPVSPLTTRPGEFKEMPRVDTSGLRQRNQKTRR